MVEEITKKIRVNSVSLASGPPYETVSVGYVTTEGPQQYSGSMVITRTELKKINVTVGDELSLKLSKSEQ